ncbi:glucan endo-1,3-beta-D-glucosidase [Chlorella sorokiniana]|uniref:Glucan endo-1,3-beta-D-glucosidase n=1 Tax=Chlorella sorokiniana TaxID=3076 RepID=A0A2P6TPB6_CHLSO|nr:glucan endo-1,3-beta-D-glucosidase [Chlorella sorokiniana]|eukprot:PRW51178.1 glucan endo-1,3-beta-D-glucosidase [Chlorella sorokiniana]
MRGLCVFALLAALVATPALAKGPIIDYQCTKKCVDDNGWNPICVADQGQGVDGTIYPNSCAWKNCVTWQESPSYDYLPLRCGSAVGCSLMGKDYEACKETWTKNFDPSYTAGSPKFDPKCGCDSAPAFEASAPAPAAEPANATVDAACVEACMESDGWEPVCVDNGRSTEEYNEWSLFPNRCAFFNCTGAAPDTSAYDYLPLRCKGASTCNQMSIVVNSCRDAWEGTSGEDPVTDVNCGCPKDTAGADSMSARRMLKPRASMQRSQRQWRRRRRRGGGMAAAAAAALLLTLLFFTGSAAAEPLDDTAASAAATAPEAAPEASSPSWAPSPSPAPAPASDLSIAEGQQQPEQAEQPPPEQQPGQQQPGGGLPWALLFSDEFEGSSLDLSKWSYLIGQGYEYGLPGFSNGEVQYYTSNPENVRVENNLLILQAQQSDPNNPWSSTSGRITTLDKFSVSPTEQYPTIRVEARIKVPQGSALWPALWMLPQEGAWANSSCIGCGKYGHWAASGEIDIMEAANDMRTAHGTLHFGGAWPDNAQLSGNVTLEAGSLADDYHVFALEWEADQMRWYIDDYNFYTARPASASGGSQGWWTVGEGAGSSSPFDTPFFLILNLAVGGPNTTFTGGAPLGSTLAQPQLMMVDYVRVHGLPYALSKAQDNGGGGGGSLS